jgi:pimeloyl-ACP methyl ester carboxylesterase
MSMSSRSYSHCRILLASAATVVLLFFAADADAQGANANAPAQRAAAQPSTLSVPMSARTVPANPAIRPFKIDFPQAALDDLRRRVLATRWPDKEVVNDASQGTQLAAVQVLARYWATGYDWRKAEAKLNSIPQFMTNIDGLDIHFIHVRSRHPNAMPLIITHGWPGSIFELVDAIDPLTNPTAHGGRAEDAFDVIIPSLPGYGFSARPSELGWGPDRIARAWDVLMKRLGYTRYVSQGGDWGAAVNNAMGRQAPAGLLAIHLSLPSTVPPEIGATLAGGQPAPAGLSEKEKAAYGQLLTLFTMGRGYLTILASRPQTVAYGLTDSPVGLAAFMLDHDPHSYAQILHGFDGHPEGGLTRDAILDNITLYWVTNTAGSTARLYWENRGLSLVSAPAQKTAEIKVPVAITVFPGELYAAPKSWAQNAYPTLTYFNEAGRGGHFASWEQPELFAAEMRAAFKSLR